MFTEGACGFLITLCRVAREGLHQVTMGRDLKEGRELWVLSLGPGAGAECKEDEVKKGEEPWPDSSIG